MLLPPLTEPLLAWYRAHSRALPWRIERTPYRVWISEIMLQQTRIEAVIPYYHRFLAALPTVEALAEVEEDVLMKLWEGLGYYSRARNLRRAAREIVEKHNGILPASFEALRALPGIGDYTAGAIASLAYGLPEPAVDGNVLRVLSRLSADGRNVLSPLVKREATEALRACYPKNPEAATAMTEALMELGEVVCIPNGTPHCAACPLKEMCEAHRLSLTDSLPYREGKAPRKIEERTILLLHVGARVGIRRRPEEGLLAGLWEFPSLDGCLTEEEVYRRLCGEGIMPDGITEGPRAKHIFTHKEWHMTSYLVSLSEICADLTFADREELSRTYAIPTAFRAFLNFLTEEAQS